jgi:hypothetical protein
MCNCQFIVHLGLFWVSVDADYGWKWALSHSTGQLQAAGPITSIFSPIQCCCITAFPQCGSIKGCYNVQLPIHCLSYGLCCECLLMQLACENEHSATARDNCRLPKQQHPLYMAPSNAAASLHFLCVVPSKEVTMCNCQFIVHLGLCWVTVDADYGWKWALSHSTGQLQASQATTSIFSPILASKKFLRAFLRGRLREL